MERFQQPPRRATQTTHKATPAQEATAAATVNPLTRIRGWVWDTSLFGFAFGAPMSLAFAVETSSSIGEALFGGAMVAVLCALMGAVSGLLGGASLRVLRGRVPALLGLLLATFAANLPWLSILLEEGRSLATVLTWLPLWILAVTVSIPVSAVRRSRGQSSERWNLAAGLLIGLGAVALRLLAAQLGVI